MTLCDSRGTHSGAVAVELLQRTLVDGRCKVYPRLNPCVMYKVIYIVKGSQNKGVCHFKIREKKKRT